MKGILLAGGTGSRLYPNTVTLNKHLLPVYDKPMIYYPLSVLMMIGITDILLICNKKDLIHYQALLSDGQQLGIHIEYRTQDNANGIAEAFIIGEDFIDNEPVCLLLGDNIFHSNNLSKEIEECTNLENGAFIFAYQVADPTRYGVVEFDHNHIARSIEEKPQFPKSDFAVPGIYFYDNRVSEIAKHIKPSNRNELEITDINKIYLEEGSLGVKEFGRGSVWFDTGTTESLFMASDYIETLETRQGLKIAFLEEIAYRNHYINKQQLSETIKNYPNSEYKSYLEKIIEK
ncbi:glucose-1-phosphate thymidylyltransferase RfbA [Carnobacterium divergens]|uniref:glucose-1-phosphate thymidylyltransferase RfbA n=1 Tax=Carnobacterium divergens TaxID=2748 RepID=UPI0007F47F98|nr:glucose-1-phosphate thymidylyltransferase RfbA [Carnobacterium divergens]SBO17640.1 glucose-1-phosphate thymidylyltransferase [Carnobacterium divergens]